MSPTMELLVHDTDKVDPTTVEFDVSSEEPTAVPAFGKMSKPQLIEFNSACPFDIDGFMKMTAPGMRKALYSTYNELVHGVEGITTEFDPEAPEVGTEPAGEDPGEPETPPEDEKGEETPP